MSTVEHIPTHWIGVPPTTFEKWIVLFIGTVSVIIAGIQPLVLGGLYEAGRLTIQQVGIAGSVELLALGLAVLIAAAFLPTRNLRLIGVLSSLLMAGANWCNLQSTGIEVVLCRLIAGIAEGVMIWLAISMVTRADKPERWTAIFLSVQTATQFAISLLVSLVIARRFGVNGALTVMAICAAIAAVASFFAPREFAPLPKNDSAAAFNLGGRAYAGLFSIFAYMAFIVGVWVYIEPIGVQAGMSHATASLAVSVSLIAQMIGGITMAAIGRHLSYYRAIVLCVVLNLCLLAILATTPGPLLFFAIVAVHGFLWLFVMPYQVLQMIDLDPTRRAALYISSVQIMGMSAGPYLASWFVTDAEVRGALGVGAACLLLSLATVVVVHGRGTRVAATASA